MTTCDKNNSTFSVDLTDELRKNLESVLCNLENSHQLGELNTIVILGNKNSMVLQPAAYKSTNTITTAYFYSAPNEVIADGFRYVLTYDQNSKLCVITEYHLSGAFSLSYNINGDLGFSHRGGLYFLEHDDYGCRLYYGKESPNGGSDNIVKDPDSPILMQDS